MKTLTLLLKPASSLCNMRCRYCFYEDEAENRMHRSMGIMSAETAELLLTKAMDYIGPGGSLTIVFQGGEPTLAGDHWFDAFTRRCRQLLPAGAAVHYALQTNGLELSEELLSVLKREHFLVGISLDGSRRLHEENRVDTAGIGTWQRVLKNLNRLQAAGIDTNALCVITGRATENGPMLYKTLKQLGLRYHQYIPCLDPLEQPRGAMAYSLLPQAYGKFLREVFDLWYADWKNGDYVSVRSFEDFVFNAMGAPCMNCGSSGRCGQYLVVEADGSLYPCDFYALDTWRLGNIRDNTIEALLTGEKAQAFAAQRQEPPEECAACPYARLCRSGCFRDWHRDPSGWHNYYCPAYKQLFAHALPRIQELARAQQGGLQK